MHSQPVMVISVHQVATALVASFRIALVDPDVMRKWYPPIHRMESMIVNQATTVIQVQLESDQLMFPSTMETFALLLNSVQKRQKLLTIAQSEPIQMVLAW